MIRNMTIFDDGGRRWLIEEIDRPDGVFEAYNLYNENGVFIGEFKDEEALHRYIMEESE